MVKTPLQTVPTGYKTWSINRKWIWLMGEARALVDAGQIQSFDIQSEKQRVIAARSEWRCSRQKIVPSQYWLDVFDDGGQFPPAVDRPLALDTDGRWFGIWPHTARELTLKKLRGRPSRMRHAKFVLSPASQADRFVFDAMTGTANPLLGHFQEVRWPDGFVNEHGEAFDIVCHRVDQLQDRYLLPKYAVLSISKGRFGRSKPPQTQAGDSVKFERDDPGGIDDELSHLREMGMTIRKQSRSKAWLTAKMSKLNTGSRSFANTFLRAEQVTLDPEDEYSLKQQIAAGSLASKSEDEQRKRRRKR